MGARILSCNEVRSYLKQSVLQSLFAPCDSSEEDPAACDKPWEKHQEVAHLTEVTFAATPQGQHWFFSPGYVTKIDYGENESASASKCKLVTHLPQNANCIHPSQTCSFRKMSACPSLGRSGKGQLLKQYEQIWDLELLHLKSFTSTEYLWYGHWKVPNLFSASPSTDSSVKDIKNNFHSEMTGWEWSSS